MTSSSNGGRRSMQMPSIPFPRTERNIFPMFCRCRIARTPEIFSAATASSFVIFPLAIVASTGTPYNNPGKWKSEAYCAVPLTFNGPSMRGVSRPIGDAVGISCTVGMFVYSLGQNRRCQQVLDADWQFAYAHTRGVIRSSCDRSRDTSQPDFSDSASAQRVHLCVGIIEEMHFHQWCVSIYRHEIVSEIRIDRRTILRVVDRVLQKRHANSHHNCAFDLVASGQRINDPPAVNDCDDTVHTQTSDCGLPCDFDKVTAVRVH